MQQEFTIPFRSGNGRVDDVDMVAAGIPNALRDSLDGESMRCWIAHDASLADALTAHFELRLDQDDAFERVAGACLMARCRSDGRQYEGCRNEGDIHGKEFDPGRKIAGNQVAGIRTLHQADSLVTSQALGNLPIARVHSEHTRGAMLEYAVGKAAGRGSHVEAKSAIQTDAPVFEGALQLESAAAYVSQVIAKKTQRRGFIHGVAGLGDFLLIDEDTPGKNQRLRPFPRGSQPSIGSEFVESYLHGVVFLS